MISVEPTTDTQYMASVISDPKVYQETKDDSLAPESPAVDFGALMQAGVVFLKAVRDGVNAGIFMFVPKERGIYEAHTILLPNCRGAAAIKAARAAVDWMFSHTLCREVRSYAFSDSPAVQWFAKAVGLHEISRQPHPATRNGNPVEMIYYASTIGQWQTQGAA